MLRTFKEWPSVDEVSPVRESRASRTELDVLRSAFFWTLVTFGTPGHAHRAAAGVHAVLPRDGSRTALIVVGQVAVLGPQVWWSMRKQNTSGNKPEHSHIFQLQYNDYYYTVHNNIASFNYSIIYDIHKNSKTQLKFMYSNVKLDSSDIQTKTIISTIKCLHYHHIITVSSSYHSSTNLVNVTR